MRRHGLLLAALVLVTTSTASAQFNPQGRTKKPKPPAGKGQPQPTRPRTPARPPADASKPTPPADAAITTPKSAEAKAPASDVLIARYLGAALAQPGADFPIQRLVELYRERDGKLDALIAELERRAAAAGSERYAALLALAGVQRLEGDLDRAIASYERAAKEQPKSAAVELALARLHEQRGDRASAKQRYERALERSNDDAEREQILRSLRALALELADFAAAERYQRELEKRARGSFFVRAELGRELLARGQHERAVGELEAVVKAASGDNRVLAPALRDLGVALARAGRQKEALVALDRALAAAGGAAGIRREVYQAIADAYRADDRLPELVARLEQTARGAEELRLLASLYEEGGRIDKALATHRLVLTREPGDVATRLKVVSLLEAQGLLDQAIAEYEALIRSAPRNPDYVFRLAGALIQRGERARALDELRRLEARAGNDEDLQAALVEFYSRLGEKDRSLALLERLAGAGGRDPQHLIELGARYWVEGDKARAIATWQRVRTLSSDRVPGLLVLGEVLLEHDLVKEALEVLAEAAKLEPGQPRAQKAYALGLERAGGAAATTEARRGYHDAALTIWEKLLREAGNNADLAREARQHVVTLWSLRGQLPQRTAGLEKRFAATPPDLEAGRLLAEAQLRGRRNADAERTLRRLTELAPGDRESWSRLERALVLSKKLNEAIAVLDRLVALEPKRAREYYQRMAEYAAELYRDDDAVRYATRAVELGPEDADGHAKLGRMHRRRQETGKAILELRQAIIKNDRAFPVYLELAELLLQAGQIDEADQLLRRVIRASPDEELVSRAARLGIQLNLGRGTLESLEREILPIAIGNPERPLFRRLLVEIYGALAYPLVHRVRTGSAADAKQASLELERLGDRAVKPLLDALSDERAAQQQVAVTLLSHVATKSAGPALVAYASGEADSTLRTRAMIAAGVTRDPALLPRLQPLLAPGGRVRADDSDPVALAAAWATARMLTPKARPLLRSLVADAEAPGLRALGALGLGLLRDTSSLPLVAELTHSGESGNLARAAGARALAMLGARGENELLAELARAPDATLRGSALLALAELQAPQAPAAIAEALTGPDPKLREIAAAAAGAWSTKSFRAPSQPLPPPDGRVDVREVLDGLRPGPYSTKERTDALEQLAPELARAAAAAARSSPERARAVIEALGLLPQSPPVPALTGDATGAELARAERVMSGIASGLVPALAGLTQHPYAPVRVAAVEFLGARPEPEARDALVLTLKDRDAAVRRAALSAVPLNDAAVTAAVAVRLANESDWALRVAAAETLGRMARASAAEAAPALARAAVNDPYAMVREASARALMRLDPAAASSVLRRLHETDPEPRVRDTAWKLLGN
jgi:cellulose synthase operon protein C